MGLLEGASLQLMCVALKRSPYALFIRAERLGLLRKYKANREGCGYPYLGHIYKTFGGLELWTTTDEMKELRALADLTSQSQRRRNSYWTMGTQKKKKKRK